MKNYGFGKTVDYTFEKAIAQVTQALQSEGFGVLTDIDVAATIKSKLNKEILPYRILGACNPEFAHHAIEAEPSIGLLLPCNIVVRQDDTAHVHIELMDPNAVLELVNKPEINQIAKAVKTRLQRVLQKI